MTSSAAGPPLPSTPVEHRSRPVYVLAGRSPHGATLDEERREVFEGVLQFMRSPEPDPDRAAACASLLRHLARTEPRRRSSRPEQIGLS
jgi:hypothetical protein